MSSATLSLFKTYLLLSLRRLYREKTYVTICIISLAIGMASFIVIGAYAYNELTFDHYHDNRDNIYLIYSESIRQEPYLKRSSGQIPYNFGRALEKEYPDIGKSVELISTQAAIGTEELKKVWNDVFFTDPSIFTMFTHDVLYGDITSAFANPHSIAISESFSRFYFGNANPLGQTLVHNDIPLTVTLVFADLPNNTFYQYSALIPIAFAKIVIPGRANDNVQMNMSLPSTLLHLDANTDVARVEAIMNEFANRQVGAEQKPTQDTTTFYLRNLSDLRIFSSDIQTGWERSSSLRFFGLIAIGFCITFVASINTINLSTARLFRQIDDINTQRLIGGRPGIISMQSLLEALCLSVGALALALVIIEICSNISLSAHFSDAFNALNWKRQPVLYLGLIVSSLLIAVCSGLYPVIKIFRLPIQSRFLIKSSNGWVSTALVAVQLLVATAAISVTTFFVLQNQFIYNTDLGLDINNRMILRFGADSDKQDIARAVEEIRQHPGVINASENLWSLGSRSFVFNSFIPGKDKSRNDPNNRQTIIPSDSYFAETMGLRFIMGGPPKHDVTEEVDNGVIISESVLDIVGWRQLPESDIIGKPIELSNNPTRSYKPIVVGVIRDFHTRSLRSAKLPISIMPAKQLPLPEEFLSSIRYHLTIHYSASYQQTIENDIKKIAKQHIPDYLFSIDHLDDIWRNSYGDEEEELKQAQFFSFIAIMLCLLGLIGLSAYAAQTRRKELGIRKVIGASNRDLLQLMGKQFFAIAGLISVPAWIAAYYIVRAWLEPFEYHIEINYWPFLTSTLIVLTLSQLTILSQSWKTARINPVESLRYE